MDTATKQKWYFRLALFLGVTVAQALSGADWANFITSILPDPMLAGVIATACATLFGWLTRKLSPSEG